MTTKKKSLRRLSGKREVLAGAGRGTRPRMERLKKKMEELEKEKEKIAKASVRVDVEDVPEGKAEMASETRRFPVVTQMYPVRRAPTGDAAVVNAITQVGQMLQQGFANFEEKFAWLGNLVSTNQVSMESKKFNFSTFFFFCLLFSHYVS